MNTWPKAARHEFRAHLIAILLERGARKTALPDEKILSFVKGKPPVARELLNELSFVGPTTAESKRKLRAIFGDEVFLDLQAMGVIGEKLLQVDKISSMVGGLIAGSQAARIIRSGPKAVAAELAKWSLVGHAIQSIPKLRKIFNRALRKGKTPATKSFNERVLRANLPEIIRLVGEAVAENSALTRFIEEATGQDALDFVRAVFGFAGGESMREEFETTTRKRSVAVLSSQGGRQLTPNEVTDSIFGTAPGSAVRPVP